ncbi:ATP-binding protein [candidate division KSB1 bacterium]
METLSNGRTLLNIIRQALTNLGAQVAIYEKDANPVWANDYFRETFGDFSEELPRICLDHLHDGDQCPSYMIRKTFESGNLQQGVFKIKEPDNISRYFKSLVIPLFEEDRAISKIIEICWDISERTAYRSILSGQNTLLDNLANASLDAILILDQNDDIIFWNNGAEQLLGYSINEILHKNLQTVIPDSQEAVQEVGLLRQLLAKQGYVKNFEIELLTKDGTTVRVELTSAFLDPERRERSGSYLIVRDISTRKDLEYIFRQTIDQLAKLHEIADLLHRSKSEEEIYHTMLVSVTAGEGLKFNRAFLLMINYENHSIEGQVAIGPADSQEASLIWQQMPQQFHSLEEILDSIKERGFDYNTRVIEIVRALSTPMSDRASLLVKAIRNKKSYLVLQNKANVEFDLKLSHIINNDTYAVIPIIGSDSVLGILIVDNVFNREPITERKVEALEIFATQAGLAIENARLHSKLFLRLKELELAYANMQDSQEKLVRAERLATIGEVVTKVSHEIRNPLVNIGGFANALLNTAEEGTDQKKFLEIISHEAQRLEKILDNILNYSKTFEPNLELCNLQDLVNKNLLVIMNDLQDHKIALVLNLDEADCILSCDPYLITQVMLNIVRNAIQAMPKGGTLSIYARKEDNNILVSVKDTGIGIKKKDHNKLLQPFYSTKARGLGLGLTISQQILSQHNGKLTVESKFRKGTVFTVHLPIS